jgi:pectate lyase
MCKVKIWYLVMLVLCTSDSVFSQIPAFPGAEGFGASASGGRGGRVVYVTNLNADGPGSLQAALNENGKRYILFKVSGVIPTTVEVPPGHGDFTIAGQTSPEGIIVRGFLSYNEEQVSSENIIIRHLRSRIGDTDKYPTSHWLAEDGITLGGIRRAIIDHCSFAHASDEAVDISRSSLLTIQQCLLAETLGGHSYLGGMLINYSSAQSRLDSLSIHHNVWNRIGGRMPEISCESPFCDGKTIHVELSNNLAWDPRIELWYEGPTPNGHFYLHLNAVNNVYHAAPTYTNGMYHFDLLNFAENHLFFQGNKMNLYEQYSDYDLFYCCNDFDQSHPNTDFGVANVLPARHAFPLVTYTPTDNLASELSASAGAFPRDAMDLRLMANVSESEIDPLNINEDHYNDAFLITNGKQAHLDSDDDGMPDYWEIKQGLNVHVQDHNGTALSNNIYGVEGYTNLECYLNCLSDALVNGSSSYACGIQLDATSVLEQNLEPVFQIYPNPAFSDIQILSKNEIGHVQCKILDTTGKIVSDQPIESNNTFSIAHLHSGIYFVTLVKDTKQIFRSKLVVF